MVNIFFGIVFILFAILWGCAVYSIKDDDMLSKIWKWLSVLITVGLFGTACVLFSLAFNDFDKPKQYQAKEYSLSIKTTTLNGKTDTTYVITKIR